ncbi:MAG TPA: ribosome small subunit-dependent GTPase A [Elusimicrobiota bacterium]|nr:ribosome small subunit-dependent GTPase A [Elusimicrobiota bacterium]
MKFSTDADEWLDETDAVFHPRAAKKKVLSRAKILPPEEGNGTVTEIFPNQSAVRLDRAARPALCRYRMATLAFGSVHRERSPVCVGDRVRVEAGVIVGRCERRNRLIRPAPNARDPLLHVLAANVDCLVIVAAAREPGFSAGIIDRFLVAASAQKIQQILCVNKSDLIKPDEVRAWSHYPAAGVAVVEASAKGGSGIERLMALLRGKIAVFCGHSGVGKTSLLRRLLSDESYGRVGAIGAASDKGRHTTSGAVLLAGPDGSSFIDTPGVMNFGLLDVAAGDLLAHFPELHAASASCAAGCAHDEEPACALRALPRYASYRAIQSSLAKNG